MDIKEKSDIFSAWLKKAYPEAKCSLDYENPYELICATALSAQCTDKRVNIITKELFRKYPVPEALASADYEELCEIIKSAGMYKVKAKNLIKMATDIVNRFGGQVPDNMEDLTSLAGVGRKTANVVLGNIYGRPGVVVDTHVKRITKRLGLTVSDDPEKIEHEMEQLINGSEHCVWGHRVISFGREICTAKNPQCAICGVKDACRYYSSL